MGSFGDKLKRERELREITLAEIADATKIGTMALQALEEEHFDRLPGGIFNKGFVRAYAKYLGLDPEEAVAGYLQAVEEQKGAAEGEIPPVSRKNIVETKPHHKETEPETPPPGGGLLAVRITVALILISAVAFLGWHFWQNWRASQMANQAASQPAPQQPVAQQPVVPPVAAPVAANTVDTGATEAPAGETSGDPINLTVKAKSRTWIAVNVDGNTVFSSLMLDPEDEDATTRSFHGKKMVRLITGNPAGIDVTFNGKSVGSLGPAGQRRTVIFTPEGRQSSVPDTSKPAAK